GSSFLGGFSATLSEAATFTYITTIGNFGKRSGGENGYSHSMVLDLQLTDRWNYVIQSDLVGYDDTTGFNGITGNDQVGINQYSFYTLSDCLAWGTRSEWWKTDGVSFYAQTYGFNYKPHANLTIRPEIRYDYTPTDSVRATYLSQNGNEYDDLRFGIDAVLTF
ncbi:MAG: outer membrane beta-barrel protein, partial [Planctomycetota bacterium]